MGCPFATNNGHFGTPHSLRPFIPTCNTTTVDLLLSLFVWYFCITVVSSGSHCIQSQTNTDQIVSPLLFYRLTTFATVVHASHDDWKRVYCVTKLLERAVCIEYYLHNKSTPQKFQHIDIEQLPRKIVIQWLSRYREKYRTKHERICVWFPNMWGDPEVCAKF